MLIAKRNEEQTLPLAQQNFQFSELVEQQGECSICFKETRRKCSICDRDFFCSDACQKQSFARHLFTCSRRSLTSADYLLESLAKDLMPEEEDVLEDFGFNNVVSSQDKTYLLGVYLGLYLFGNFHAEEIHEWRIQGILADKIKEFAYSIPESSRGHYLPWFLNNPGILDRPSTKQNAQAKLVATFYDKANPYLEAKDRNKAAQELKPQAKQDCYNLLAEILLRMSPSPAETNWCSFGFVTCRGRGEESTLVDIYQLLLTKSDGSFFYEFHNSRRHVVDPATFTQFWKAYETGTLIQLMDSKDLKKMRLRLPYLEEFLSVPLVGPHPSAWTLKQFLEINDPIDHPPGLTVSVDYGFMNCETVEETYILMEIYGRVLKVACPLGLHQACIEGKLADFASPHMRLNERWISLMRNTYTLRDQVDVERKLEYKDGTVPKVSEGFTIWQWLASKLWGSSSG